jgi:hypothetical protein
MALPPPDEPLPEEGNDAVEPPDDVDGIEGADVPPVDVLGIGDELSPPGSEGADEPPVLVLGMPAPESPDGLGIPPPPELPPESPDGLGAEGAPPPAEFVLQPPAKSAAPMAMANKDVRSRRAFWSSVFIA